MRLNVDDVFEADYQRIMCAADSYSELLAEEAEEVLQEEFPNGLTGAAISEAIGDMADDELAEAFRGGISMFGAAITIQVTEYWSKWAERKAEQRIANHF